MNVFIAGILSFAFLVAATLGTHAAICAPREEFLAALEEVSGVVSLGSGVNAGGETTTEILVSVETGAWTVLMTTTDGSACVVAAGEGWEFAVQEEKKGQGT